MRKNREYKSDVFSMLMESKENALEIYNALNDSGYTNPEDVRLFNWRGAYRSPFGMMLHSLLT